LTKKSKQSGQSPQHFNPWTIQESKGLSITLSTETHRLALYLQDTFKGWDVDCEYNRNRYDTKKLIMGDDIHLKVETTQTDDEQGKTVYPDIIVHRRGTDHNLLVSEVQRTSISINFVNTNINWGTPMPSS
jgi:hypothetical protein